MRENTLLEHYATKFTHNEERQIPFEMLMQKQQFRELPFETQYALSLVNILDNGTVSGDRTGTGTTRFQNDTIHVDLTRELPLLQGKFVSAKGALVEMLWIMMGRTDLKFLKDNGVNYWDSWELKNADGSGAGHFGPIYGKQMRDFGGVDQLKDVVQQLRVNPDSRRIISTLWNPIELTRMALPPCHYDYQICSFINDAGVRVMDLHVKQRSADAFIGVPYDLMLFYYFLKIISLAVGIPMNRMHLTLCDYHIYSNHHDQVKQYVSNYFDDPLDIIWRNGTVRPCMSWREDLFDGTQDIDVVLGTIYQHLNFDVYTLTGYDKGTGHYPFIKADVAV